MKYMLLIYSAAAEMPEFTPEQARAGMQAWIDFAAEAQAAGVRVSNHRLQPVTEATTVSIQDGETFITDGPFAETREQLGGYFLIECKDKDEAIRWALKMPGARYGKIEIRPVQSYE